jgi:hypothetical protein
LGSHREAEAKSHAVLAELARDFEIKRLAQTIEQSERTFLDSPALDTAAAKVHALMNAMELGGAGYAPAPGHGLTADELEFGIKTGSWRRRPERRAEAIHEVDAALEELEAERAGTSLVRWVDEDGEPAFVIPTRYVGRVQALLDELFEADRRSLEAQRAVIAGDDDGDAAERSETSLAALARLWEAQRKPAARTRLEMQAAIARCERVNGALPYAEVTDEHARRMKTDLLADPKISNATRQKPGACCARC